VKLLPSKQIPVYAMLGHLPAYVTDQRVVS